ncbi:MAG: hypothetical protein Q8O43_08985 [Dehalococcoidia bacterium]|nr:hypothetical protein [Dehalococcoidia bacterium]
MLQVNKDLNLYMSSGNIFSALAKYNSATDENYLTESFVFVISSILKREPDIGIELLNNLCVNNCGFSFSNNEKISVSTQDVTEQGTPDIKISSPEKLIYIEVKHESDLGYRQIERYKEVLTKSPLNVKRVVLLTHYPIDFQSTAEKPDKHVRWFEVYDWLVDSKYQSQDSVIIYLLEHFTSFLEAKGMIIKKVGLEYVNGMHALNSLMNMIESAIEASGIRFFQDYPRSAGWGFKGYWMEEKKYWCGIHFNNPTVLTFELTDKGRFNQKTIEKMGYEMREGKERLWFRLPLEENNFFSLDKDKQLEMITDFVRKSYSDAERMIVKPS